MAITKFDSNNAQVQGTFEKAKGFINIYLIMKSGKKRQLGAIRLLESDSIQNTIYQRLVEETLTVEELLSKLDFSFNPVTEVSEEDLDF